MKTINKKGRKLGWLRLIAVIGVMLFFANAAFAATVQIRTGSQANEGVYESGGSPALAAGDLVQIIDAAGEIDPPNSDGSLGGDDSIIITGIIGQGFLINPSGRFTIDVAVNPSQTFYVRAWNDTSASSATHYGNSELITAPSNVADGDYYNLGDGWNITPGANSHAFDTDNAKPVPGPNVSVSPATHTFSAAEGNNPSPNNVSITISNTGTAALNTWNAGTITYGGGQSGWISLNSTSGGPIAAGGSDSFTATVGDVSAFTENTYTATIPLTFSQGLSSQDVTITLNITGDGPPPEGDFTIEPSSAYIGQTIVLSDPVSAFAADPGTVTVGGVTANPTAWSTDSITLAVPDGVAAGSVTVDVDGQTASLTINSGGVVIDDVEGGSVGTWGLANNLADSGYYSYDEGVTPDTDNITADGPQTTAVKHGEYGMRVSYDGAAVSDAGYGGGWGAKLSNSLDLSSYDEIKFFIKWDGSNNSFKFALNDSAGHSYFASVSSALLNTLTGYDEIVLVKTDFAEDVENPDRVAGALDWTDIVSYNITYITKNASGQYQYIDSISAGDVNWGDPSDPDDDDVTDVIITEVQPAKGPAGTRFTAIGSGFGIAQGQSLLVFENRNTGITYSVKILSWSDTEIEAIVPRVAPAGNYQLKVIKLEITAAGNMRAQESNPESFIVTGATPPGGNAVIFPNPFNPLATELAASGMSANQATIAFDANGAPNIGIYIYDATARLVYQGVTTDTQITWDGRDNGGSIVADGIYLLRVVNADTKSLIAKGKILVIKSN
jgi:hypothetical protein